MSKSKYTESELIEAVKTSHSVRQVLSKLSLIEAGGNYKTIKNLIQSLSLDTSHFFKNRCHNKGKKLGPKRPIQDYLNNERKIQSDSLKKRLLNEKIFEPVCSSCKLTEWLGQNIPLELDHIDGNNEDNSLSNLRLLCPNCHAQTPTYRGKNIK